MKRRADIARRRADLQARRGEAKGGGRWPWQLLSLVLLLLLAWQSCRETPAPPPAPPCVVGVELVEPGVALPPVPKAPRIGRIDRPEYKNEAPDPLPWLAAFRLQVAARAPRLAQCFVGVERPGALKWTTSVEPASGRVSDHTLEPAFESAPLTTEQRACVLGVLTDPPYRLEIGAERSTPPRVAVAIEF